MNLKELRYQITARENLSGKLDRVTGASNRTSRALGTQNRHLSSLKKNISSAASQLPFFSNAMGLATNPILLATAAGVGFIAMLSKAKDKAAAFNTEFRDLYNLNLDKTPFQTAKMRSDVLNTSANFGFDAERTSQAYYDVQSIANIQGYAAGQLIGKTGQFAQVMRSNFNETIAGTAQVMDIYGISINKVDDYLSSMYKTVMVGKTTFDEMSKVQVEYANAASAAGQSYDAANKIFAAFSKTQKTSTIASTMTKTAFQDLTKKSTLDGLSKIGVNVFNAKKEMLGVDVILQNMIPKLQSMNDLEFANLKEEIGGSEGIKGLLDLAKNSGDKLLASFNQFDNSDMAFDKALTNARSEINFIDEQINNKLKVSWITLGDTVLPMWVSIKQTILSTVDELNDSLYSMQRNYYAIVDRSKYKQLGRIRDEQKEEIGRNKFKESLRGEMSELLGGKWDDATLNSIKKIIEQKTLQLEQLVGEVGSDPQLSRDRRAMSRGKNAFGSELLSALNAGDNSLLKQLFGVTDSESAIPDQTSIGGTTGAAKTAALGAGGQKVINITIEKFQDEININGASFTASNDEMVSQMEEGFLRVLQGVEEAYG